MTNEYQGSHCSEYFLGGPNFDGRDWADGAAMANLRRPYRSEDASDDASDKNGRHEDMRVWHNDYDRATGTKHRYRRDVVQESKVATSPDMPLSESPTCILWCSPLSDMKKRTPFSKKKTRSTRADFMYRHHEVHRTKFHVPEGRIKTPQKSSTRNYLIANSTSILFPRAGMRFGDSPLSRTRMTTNVASELRKFVTTQHASCQDIGFSSAQDQKRLGSTTSGNPTNRAATGTEKHYRFLEHTKNLDTTQSYSAPLSLSSEPSNRKEEKEASTSM